jgi:hypothetical protein
VAAPWTQTATTNDPIGTSVHDDLKHTPTLKVILCEVIEVFVALAGLVNNAELAPHREQDGSDGE